MITNTRLVAKDVGCEAYTAQEVQPGHPEFVMSRGQLVEFDSCPSRWLAGVEDESTKSTDWGSLIDCMVMSPDKFESKFAVCPAEYPSKKDGMKPWNWNADFCKEWREARAHLKPVKADDYQLALTASEKALADPQIKALIDCSDRQVMMVAAWQDEGTGLTVPVRILIDLLPRLGTPYADSLADFKTCINAAPVDWGKAVFNHNYHVQAALYTDVVAALEGKRRKFFLHALQENFPPFQTGKRCLIDGGPYMELGRDRYQKAFARYCACLKTGIWPGYEVDNGASEIWNGWQSVEPEMWMIKNDLRREA